LSFEERLYRVWVSSMQKFVNFAWTVQNFTHDLYEVNRDTKNLLTRPNRICSQISPNPIPVNE